MSRERKLRSKAVRRAEPDLPKLSRALLQLAEAQAEVDAQQEHQQQAEAAVKGKAS